MNNTTTLPAWMEQIQAEITATEWTWRQLDEQEWRNRDLADQDHIALGKHDMEAEADRLRTELVVASFLDAFHGDTHSDIGRTVAARLGGNSWSDAIINRLGLALFIQAETERSALPDAESRWSPATALHDPRSGAWWLDVEAVYLWHGEELSRHQYRFHVVDDRVEGWMALVEAGQTGEQALSAHADGPTLPRLLRIMVGTVAHLPRARRCA